MIAALLPASTTTPSLDPAYDWSVADSHWAFVPLSKPDVPEVDKSAIINEVDAFVLEKLHKEGLDFNAEADRRSLIRRLTYDLTGLPPSYADVEAFVTDTSSDAYERLVEKLLASPAYGERWARHWLDVARYADTKGIFRRGRYSFSHTYRDYVIQAFNEDKPYDRFVLEQIAADQLELKDKADLAAMGFLTLGRTFFGRKDYIIDDQIDVVTRGLQGLTVTCARCHDHKSDPIPSADYYSLHGIFNSSRDAEELPVIRYPEDGEAYKDFLKEVDRIETEIQKVSDEVVDTFLIEERSLTGTYLSAADGGKGIEDEEAFKVYAGSHGLNANILRLWIDYLAVEENKSHPVLRSWFEDYADKDEAAGVLVYNARFAAAAKRLGESSDAISDFLIEPGSPLNPDREEVAVWIRRRIGGKTGELQGELLELDWTHPGAPIKAHVLEDIEKPKNSSIYKRGDPKNLGDEVPRRYLTVLAGLNGPSFSSGSGRLELAQAIADESNPLTARVMVNRLWGWHMGEGIVDTASDFGVQTPRPIHLDLLNWLAASFMESDWSIKSLHRLIVLSRTYRQASEPQGSALERDPQNRLWHHFPKTRLDFESMRDTLLAVAGNLDPAIGGLPVDITDPTTNRRTIYGFIDRQDMPGLFRTFDHPSPEASSPGRFETVVPQQALFLMNDPFVVQQSRHLAKRVRQEAGNDPETVVRTFYQVVYQREATQDEIQTGVRFLGEMGSGEGIQADASSSGEEHHAPLDASGLYAQALLMSNELLFLD